MDQDLRVNIRVRASLKQKLTYLGKYIDTIKNSQPEKKPNMSEIQTKIENYATLYDDFETVQLKIETSCEDEQLPDQYNEREQFESKFTESMGFLRDFKTSLEDSQVRSSSTHTNSSNIFNQSDSLQNLLIPKMKIPTFQGDYEQWMEFKVSFDSIISSTTLSSGHKFQLLRNSVTGYAKRLISAVTIDEHDPFGKAWHLLTDKFDKKRLLVNKHIKNLFNLEPIRKETLSEYKSFLDNVSSNITAIENTKISKENLCNALLIYIISNKFDNRTMREWKNQDLSEFPTINELLEFLNSKTDLLEDISDQKLDSSKNYSGKAHNQVITNKNFRQQVQVNSTFNKGKCNFCQKDHLIYTCKDFLQLDNAGRIAAVERLSLCHNCLRIGHAIGTCSLGPCKRCGVKHNSLICEKFKPSSTNFVIENQQASQSDQVTFLVNPHTKRKNDAHQVLLSTVSFFIQTTSGEKISCRALLDSGSQVNLLAEHFVKSYQLPLLSTHLAISGINQTVSNIKSKCILTISSKFNDFSTTMTCYVIPTISSHTPTHNIVTGNYNIPDHIQLSDPEYHLSKPIDAIIGSTLFWNLINEGKITLGKNLPILQNTKLGWIVAGPISTIPSNVSCNFTRTISEDFQLKKFWEIEEVNYPPISTQDDTDCEKIFQSTTYRNCDGRFVVQLPLKHSPSLLGDSRNSAEKQFISLERKFTKDDLLKSQYSNFMQEYLSLGHLSKIQFPIPNTQWSYFLPHHGVLKQDSLTTKLRVVFNGSNPTDSGWSLNDLQYVGPKVQNDIFPILIRFRMYTYVVSADIMKMYRQILIHPDHRPLQLILWRDHPNHELEVFQLNTVTYGTTSAPYLAIKCLKELSSCCNDPLLSDAINNDFYVDDLLTGHNDFHTIQNLCKSMYEHLASAGFLLRKWISNHHEVLSQLDIDHDPLTILNLSEQEASKTLGIKWFSKSDQLQYSISQPHISDSISKRQILSEIAQIYDPLGLLSPAIILAKIIIQRLWSLKLTWDDPIPVQYSQQWSQFRGQLVNLNQLEISRHVIGKNSVPIEFHFFSDASQHAYASCCYIRSQDTDSNITVRLLCSKTKVSPIKTLSIPRLELCGALLSAQLADQVQKALKIDIPCYFWTDSQVVLAWLQLEPKSLEVFVSNRVAKIQNLTNPHQWYYVSTKQNPADIASRGVLPNILLKCNMWWQGPMFLKEHHSDFSHLFKSEDFSITIPEVKRDTQNLFYIDQEPTIDVCTRFSNLTRLKRIMALCSRFISNIRFHIQQKLNSTDLHDPNISSVLRGPLTQPEIDSTFIHIIKYSQYTFFKREIDQISQNEPIGSSSKLIHMSPFLDPKGILRVGGRLKFTSLPTNQTQPILLSSQHCLTKLIFEDTHENLLHPGPQLLLANVRQHYWPIGGRKLAKQVVNKCIICFKQKPKPFQVAIGNLPDDRVIPGYPFQTVGIDFAGPFKIKDKKGRGCKIFKCYVSVFVCFVTKAVHLELLSDMTTECFFACFRRFISRRGLPSKVYSDNGSTFKGACNELKTLAEFLQTNQNQIHRFAVNLNIVWNFIPPYSPNFGGLWEAAVKQMKHHLTRTMTSTSLTYEEFSTLLYQIEAILNSRPLYAMSSDPNDLEPLTPSHFLIHRSLTALPDFNLLPLNPLRLNSYQKVQQLYQAFWSRFSIEYVTQLHQTYKWRKTTKPINTGTLVLVQDKHLPPGEWLMGRIIKIFPGKDTQVRVAEIKTSKGILKRSTRHLHPLPIEPDN